MIKNSQKQQAMRTQAINQIWQYRKFDKFDKYAKKAFTHDCYEKWIKSSFEDKMLDICYLTILYKHEFPKYLDQAYKIYKELTGHDY